jgi:hypothetical protein
MAEHTSARIIRDRISARTFAFARGLVPLIVCSSCSRRRLGAPPWWLAGSTRQARVSQVVFADNAYHRIHHSDRDRHFHKNFAAYFSVWDRCFGTYQEPEAGGLPSVGLAGVPPPQSMRDYLFSPFRK